MGNSVHYGLAYQGSKNGIAEELIKFLPHADTFVDLFCGGCSMTHIAIYSGKYSNFIINDINPTMPSLFVKAINGDYLHEDRWVSREDFYGKYKDDGFIRLLWSFGNNQKQYIYGREMELHKKALHYAIYFEDYSLLGDLGFDVSFLANHTENTVWERYILLQRYFKGLKVRQEDICSEEIINIDRFSRLNTLEILKRLNELYSLKAFAYDIRVSSTSYENVIIPKNSVVYCDPPYANTYGYSDSFDHEKFYNWCCTSEHNIFISEYNMPEDRFTKIHSMSKCKSFSPYKSKIYNIESLYAPKKTITL